MNPAAIVFTTCLGLKPTESVLIVCDTNKRNEAELFLSASKQITDNSQLITIHSMTQNAQEPPAAVFDQMAKADIVLLVTTYSLSHTQARKNACTNGARIISMPGITLDMIHRTVPVDYPQMAATSLEVAAALTRGSQVAIVSPGGTNLRLSLADRVGIADTGLFTNPGDFGNLPAGEAFVAPVEGTAEGTIVFDGAFANIKLDEPIKLELSGGAIYSISGGKAAKKLETILTSLPPQARQLCELGIGTNTKARLCPEVLEAEKVYGTCHIAFGNNATFGGTIVVPFHSDGVIQHPTVTIDGTIVVSSGEINY